MKPELFEFEAPRIRVLHDDHDHLESMGVAKFDDECVRGLAYKLGTMIALLERHQPDDDCWKPALGNLQGMLSDIVPGLRAGAYLSLLESPDGVGLTLAVMGVSCPQGEIDGRERWMLPGDAALTLGFDMDSFRQALVTIHDSVTSARKAEIARRAVFQRSVH